MSENFPFSDNDVIKMMLLKCLRKQNMSRYIKLWIDFKECNLATTNYEIALSS